ncbi:MAG: glycoside hydrolase family 65 protein [Firmicutes bacterium]|nr:glycoside hydrolase family 65 protein [Bacillota bacterium]
MNGSRKRDCSSLFEPDAWSIREEGFHPERSRFTESIFSLANEHMGVRGFFEEGYSGDSLPGTYVAGVYYPDRTKVGWWKIGYPEYYARLVNLTNWLMVGVELDGERIDLAIGRFRDFRRTLDMRRAVLTRSYVWQAADGRETGLTFTRFLSLADPELACISVTVTPLDHAAVVVFMPALDGGVINEDANYGEVFLDEVERGLDPEVVFLTMRTRKTAFDVCTAMTVRLRLDGAGKESEKIPFAEGHRLGWRLAVPVAAGRSVTLEKYVAVCTSRDHPRETLARTTTAKAQAAGERGFTELLAEHGKVMAEKWAEYDVEIEGDVCAQQGVRYNILQLLMTYQGRDPLLNIGPKGLTGEKYGGGAYWDTEGVCFPFYLYTDARVARNLLLYRYRHLRAAEENAARLGLPGALYPMATMDGRECHNEWEITFEEIHRNAAIAYAIYSYTEYTGDRSYLFTYGLEVLVAISRFWAGRVTYNPRKDCYMLLGVTGPNEYENNVNNNWYTNLMAAWTIEYTLDALDLLAREDREAHEKLVHRLGLTEQERWRWREIQQKMYYPYDDELGIFIQNDGYLDKEQITVADIPPEDLPLNQHWSWDRILRSPFIKQADVVQGLYFLPDRFDLDCQRRNFDYYEARTVHESSLSPCVHSIVASRIGYREKAYQLFLRSARLDLEDLNGDTRDGLHLTSMGGTWAALVQGFAGMRVKDDRLSLAPYLPSGWRKYSFQIEFRGRRLAITVEEDKVVVGLLSGEVLEILIHDRPYRVSKDQPAIAALRA